MKHMHTPGPWKLGKYDECGGYDCMTAGIKCGPALLDGKDYGQVTCSPMKPDAASQMQADARLIAAAPDLLAALEYWFDSKATPGEIARRARAAIAKARGED